jgi:hypothetical protein
LPVNPRTVVSHCISWSPLSDGLADCATVDGVGAYDDIAWLGPFSSLNVLIGPNNSGKSRVLRDLAAAGTAYPVVSAANGVQRLAAHFESIGASLLPLLQGGTFTDPSRLPPSVHEYFGHLRAAAAGRRGALCRLLMNNAALLTAQAEDAQRAAGQWLHAGSDDDPWWQLARFLEAARDYGRASKSTAAPHFRRVYIPVLRGLRPFDGNGTGNPFHARTLTDYFKEARKAPKQIGAQPEPPSIVTGLEAFADIRRHKAGNTQQQATVASYEEFLQRRFFGGQRVVLTAREVDDSDKQNAVVWIKIGGERQRPIHHLGDGLGQVVIQTWPLFQFRSEHLLLFVEEPETHLHPGFQRLLIDAFLSEPCTSPGSRQVFVTTHSNVFMDMILDSERVRLFHVAKPAPRDAEDEYDAKVAIRAEPAGSLRLLRELGATNSSVLLVNCTVWVEGRSDRLYLRHYLELLARHLGWDSSGQRLKEDLHFAFMEYSGSNIVHWSFLDEQQGTDEKRLCGTLFLVADDDGAAEGRSPGKAARHERLRGALGDRFWPLPCREIENLLSPAVVAAVVRDYEGDQGLALQAFGWDEMAKAPLGKFIEGRVLPEGYASKRKTTVGRPYADSSGTVKDKDAFALRAIGRLAGWADLTPQAQELTKAVARFVRAMNALPEDTRLSPVPGVPRALDEDAGCHRVTAPADGGPPR